MPKKEKKPSYLGIVHGTNLKNSFHWKLFCKLAQVHFYHELADW